MQLEPTQPPPPPPPMEVTTKLNQNDEKINLSIIEQCKSLGNDEELPKTVMKKFLDQILKLKWSNIIILFVLHLLTLIAGYFVMNNPIKLYTYIFAAILGLFSGMGMSIGGHRLWAHRSFKATLTLRIILAIFQVMTMNGSAYSYARDHRTHHKHSDTDQDPKNPSRGLFYSHIGWWMLKKSDKVKNAGSKLDFTDLKEDKVCWYQHKFYTPLFIVFGVILPTIVPHYGWNENIWIAFYLCAVMRITVVLHHLFTVNSIAHFFGSRPYDFRIRPTENRLVIYISLGEGNHNYHHTFPFDYSSSEKKAWEFFNPSTLFIDLFSLLGMAYDCKKASRNVIDGTVKRKGIPAYFDPVRGLWFRIFNGIFDWILGSIVAVWPLVINIIYKYLTGQDIYVR